MKKTIQMLFCAAGVMLMAASCENSKVYTVNVSGEGADFYPDSSLGADPRFDEPVAYDRLDKGSFYMSFQDSVSRRYNMIFETDFSDGSFQVFKLLSDRAPLHFQFSTKYGMANAVVSGSSDNEEMYLYSRKQSEGYDVVDSMDYMIDLWIAEHYGEDGWPEEGSEGEMAVMAMYDRVNEVYDSIKASSDYPQWKAERMRTHKTLAGLEELTGDISYQIQLYKSGTIDSIDASCLSLLEEYKKKFPGNDMISSVEAELAAIERVRPGMPAPDFSAPALDGDRHTLSELIEGKIAVLDCWASWCAPCRKHSIELIPVYEHGYPWIQLYDLDRAEGIWELYDIAGGGGGIFLIGSDGRIVEKVTDIASVRSYLQEHCRSTLTDKSEVDGKADAA